MKIKNTFEQKYFDGYYYRNVGNFTKKDLQKSINWFYGWFRYLQKFVDLERGKGKSVLEIGCSIGGVSHLLSERGFEVYASDISYYAIKKAEKLAINKNMHFKVFDVEKGIPIDEKFDFIIAFEVIEHLSNPAKAILTMKSKLKSNGILICSTPNGEKDVSLDPTHINVKKKSEWRKLFEKANFSRIEIKQVSFLPFFYRFSQYLHMVIPVAIYSKYINSPLFIIAKK